MKPEATETAPHLFLLPGLDGTGLLYDDFRACLLEGYTLEVVAYPTDEPLDYEALLPYVKARLPCGKRWILIGESFSGPLAIRCAAAQPEGLCGLVLCATFARRPLPVPAWLVPSWLFRLPVPSFAMRYGLFERGAVTQDVRDLIALIQSVVPEVLTTRLRALLRVDVREALATIDIPTLYLGAGRDRVVGSSSIRTIQAVLPSLDVVLVPDAPHLLLQRRPREAAQALLAWVQSLGLSG